MLNNIFSSSQEVGVIVKKIYAFLYFFEFKI